MALIEFDGVVPSGPDLAGGFGADIDETFEELYCQHVAYVRNIARASTRTPADAEDVTAEVFAGLLLALRNGRGPVEEARPYLRACVRNEVARARTRGGRHRLVNTDPEEFESVVRDESGRTFEDVTAERATIVSAFKRLSERHQMVLLAIEVHGRSHAEVARELAISASAVTALAKRARDAFALAYLDEHLGGAAGDCGAVRRTLAAVVRGTETPRRRRRAYEHLQQCDGCAHVHRHLTDVNKMLRSLPAGVLAASSSLVGGGASSGLLAGLKNLLGIGGSSAGTHSATATSGVGLAGGLGASGAAGIQQVATLATLALSAMFVTGESLMPVPEEETQTAAPVIRSPESAIRADAMQAAPTTRPSVAVESRPAEFTLDDLPPKSVEKQTRRTVPDKTTAKAPVADAPVAHSRLGAGGPITDDHLEPASDNQPPPPADDDSTVVGPADAVEQVPPADNQPDDHGSAPTTSAPPRTSPPPATTTPPPPAGKGPIENVTSGLDDTVDQVTNSGGTVLTGVTDEGAEALDDVGASVDELLKAAGLPPLAGQVVDPVTGTVRTVDDVLNDGLGVVNATVDDTTDVADGLLGTDGAVDVQRLLDGLLGGP